MGFIIKRKKEIKLLREANRLVAQAFTLLGEYIKPGVTLKELDLLTETFIKDHGALTLYKGYQMGDPHHPPFPGVICASVNNVICHGFPDERVLLNGDIVGIDIGLKLKGYCGDACITFPVGEISPETAHLLDVAKKCLDIGIKAAQPGNYLGEIGDAIEAYATKNNTTVVREWGGHGIGRNLHEPLQVSHISMPYRGPILKSGMVFTIEPMINLGSHEWVQLDDGWTVETADGSLSAQFEHTIAITSTGNEILSVL